MLLFEKRIELYKLYNRIDEKLAEVDSDVDLIYDKYFRSAIDGLKETGTLNFDLLQEHEISTTILQSERCKEAHKLNPCIIVTNSKKYGNYKGFYAPKNTVILVNLHPGASELVKEYGGSVERASEDIDYSNREQFRSEFTEEVIKGTIHHELAHWIDDTLHNRHIRDRVLKATEGGKRNLNAKPIDMSNMEIEGQIHNIKQLYNTHKDEWDDISFDYMISLSPTLKLINGRLRGDDNVIWRKAIQKRMYREGLMGAKMR